ncbi:MAG: hypothetical protein RBT45_03080, partial [Acholeplasmataceae bacterium]|nr:hypothetical protein [Acholeplasmataceae bacterium]
MAIYTYQTELLTNFSKEENQKGYLKGLETVRSYLGKSYDLVINGKRVKTSKQMKSLNPSNHAEIVGTISQ